MTDTAGRTVVNKGLSLPIQDCCQRGPSLVDDVVSAFIERAHDSPLPPGTPSIELRSCPYCLL